MGIKRFTDKQIEQILDEAEMGEGTVKEVLRKYNVSGPTFYKWRKERRSLKERRTPQQGDSRLQVLEDENRRLRAMIIDQALEIAKLREPFSGKGRA